MTELQILLVVGLVIVLFLLWAWFTGRKAIVLKAMKIVEVVLHSSFGQEKLKEAIALVKVLIDVKFAKYPIIKSLVLWLLNDKVITKVIEQNIPVVNAETKPLVQGLIAQTIEQTVAKIPVKADSLIGLAENLKVEAKDKGFFVAEAGANGSTEKQGIDWYGKLGFAKKF